MTKKTWLWLLLVISVGSALGVGFFTFFYARGWSYLTNDPQTCVNCHIMQPVFEAWNHSSHRPFATCNDCHTPADPVQKWVVKGKNGFWHSVAFTSGAFHEPIEIKPSNRLVTEQQCRFCHTDVVAGIDQHGEATERLRCTSCHSDVGHKN